MTQRENTIGRFLRIPAHAAFLVSMSTLGAQTKPSAAIPATAPTQSVSDLPSARPAVQNSTPHGESYVTWNGANLTVDAGGSALPEIVQQIARETGMRITGGVPDERVFGTYGPGPVQVVMGQLFDGLAINMMLVNESETSPKELVLTTRSGAASPPQVRQVANDDDRMRRHPTAILPAGQEPGRASVPQQRGLGGSPNYGGSNDGVNSNPIPPPAALGNNSTPDTSATNNSSATTSSTPSAGTDQQQSPSGVRTPEQIFEELRKRQKQQQQATPTQ